jgi:hypothetical protein
MSWRGAVAERHGSRRSVAAIGRQPPVFAARCVAVRAAATAYQAQSRRTSTRLRARRVTRRRDAVPSTRLAVNYCGTARWVTGWPGSRGREAPVRYAEMAKDRKIREQPV